MKLRDTFYWSFPTKSLIDFVVIGQQTWYTAASVKRYLHTNTNTATLLSTLPKEYQTKKAYVGKTDVPLNYRLRIFWSILFSEETVKYLCRRRKYPYPDLGPLENPKDIPDNQYTISEWELERQKRINENKRRLKEEKPWLTFCKSDKEKKSPQNTK